MIEGSDFKEVVARKETCGKEDIRAVTSRLMIGSDNVVDRKRIWDDVPSLVYHNDGIYNGKKLFKDLVFFNTFHKSNIYEMVMDDSYNPRREEINIINSLLDIISNVDNLDNLFSLRGVVKQTDNDIVAILAYGSDDSTNTEVKKLKERVLALGKDNCNVSDNIWAILSVAGFKRGFLMLQITVIRYKDGNY